MFFVLNVGRSGSRTIAQVLSQSPNCSCLHEPRPLLLEESLAYRTGEVSQAELVRLLRESRVESPGMVRGESANRLALVIPALREAFPGAQHAWLVRDGRAMICSAMQRGWYEPVHDGDGSAWDLTRPTAVVLGDADEETWSAWSQFDRLCWYWASMNRRIRDEADDPLLVRLEELPARLGALADHVGIEPVDFVVTRANRRYEVTGDGGPGRPPHAVRANAVEHRLTVDDWTDEQHATFDDVCGPLMDDLYPGWRDRAPDTEVATNGPEADAGSDRAGPAPGHAAPTLAAVYEQLGELRFADQEFRGLRDDLRELRNRHRAIDEEFRGLREDLQELRGERADLAQRLADERGRRRAAEEAERGATRRRDEAERELADLRAESTAEQRRLRASLSDAVHRAEDERRRRAAVTQSRTYRAALLLRRASIMARKAARRARAVTDRIAPSAGQDRTGDHGASPSDPPATPVADDRAKRVLQIPTVDGGDPAVVYALVVFDVADEELASLLRRVTDEQERHRDVGILWITDSEAFGRFRAVNALFEHIPPRSRWEGHHDGDYDRYRARRLRLLEQSYRPDRTVPVEGSSESWSATLALLDADLVGAS